MLRSNSTICMCNMKHAPLHYLTRMIIHIFILFIQSYFTIYMTIYASKIKIQRESFYHDVRENANCICFYLINFKKAVRNCLISKTIPDSLQVFCYFRMIFTFSLSGLFFLKMKYRNNKQLHILRPDFRHIPHLQSVSVLHHSPSPSVPHWWIFSFL